MTTPVPGTSGPARIFSGSIFTKTLYDNRRVLTAWAAATGLLAMMYGSFYPQISADSVAGVPESMRGFGSTTSPAPPVTSRGPCSACSSHSWPPSTAPRPEPG